MPTPRKGGLWDTLLGPGSPVTIEFQNGNAPQTYILKQIGADGHYMMEKTTGSDRGLYALPCPAEEPPPRPPSPRDLKEDAIDKLEAVKASILGGAPDVGDAGDAVEGIDEAIEHIKSSLDPELWAKTPTGEIDPGRLDPDEGEEVFEEECEATEEIFSAISDGKIDNREILDQLFNVVRSLVDADRILAEVAIRDAIAAGGDPGEAVARLKAGDQIFESIQPSDDLDTISDQVCDGMESYGDAWDAAVDTIAGDGDDDGDESSSDGEDKSSDGDDDDESSDDDDESGDDDDDED